MQDTYSSKQTEVSATFGGVSRGSFKPSCIWSLIFHGLATRLCPMLIALFSAVGVVAALYGPG